MKRLLLDNNVIKISALLFLVFVFGAAQVRGSGSFYALSSLRFFLEEQDNNEQTIAFDQADVEALWEKASSDPATDGLIKGARSLHRKGGDRTLVKELLNEAWDVSQDEFFNKSAKKVLFYPQFDDNPLFDLDMKLQILPFLLPLKHPMKKVLDGIFTSTRAIENPETFLAAGFITYHRQHRTRIVVAGHPLAPGYLFKVYFDSENRIRDNHPGWARFVDRCRGAQNIRELIQIENIKHFVVPDKWIYPLPIHPKSTEDEPSHQPIVLMVTDMQLEHKEIAREAWKNSITREHLDELYSILSHGYASAYLTANIPLTKQGKFACVDTEYVKRTINYQKARHYFSEEMALYWDELVRMGGKKED